jgi:hypothetical protein
MFFMLTAFLIPWTDTMTNTMLADAGNVITDLSPLLVPVIGVFLGIIVIGAIVRHFHNPN